MEYSIIQGFSVGIDPGGGEPKPVYYWVYKRYANELGLLCMIIGGLVAALSIPPVCVFTQCCVADPTLCCGFPAYKSALFVCFLLHVLLYLTIYTSP